MTMFQKFSKCKIGQQVKHIDKTGREKLVVCTEKSKGVPQWKFVDGKRTFNRSTRLYANQKTKKRTVNQCIDINQLSVSSSCEEVMSHKNPRVLYVYMYIFNRTKMMFWLDFDYL